MKSADFFPFLEYGSRLRELRKADQVVKAGRKKARTQAETAALVGVNERTYKDWERGVSLPDTRSLLKLSDLYGVSLDYLMCRAGSRTVNGDAISGLTGFTPAAVDEICEEYKIFKQNFAVAADFSPELNERSFTRKSSHSAASVLLSDLIENAPDDFYEFMRAVHAYIVTAAAPPDPAQYDTIELGEYENQKNAQMYRASVEMSNMLTAAADRIRQQMKEYL